VCRFVRVNYREQGTQNNATSAESSQDLKTLHVQAGFAATKKILTAALVIDSFSLNS
jgi:hypothetical protein